MTNPDNAILDARLRVPQQVVYRPFAAETVVLNLETGQYHGLNPSGGRMLEVLDQSSTVREAAVRLADEFGVAQEEIERDLVEFCADLIERRLIEVRGLESA
jgi:hypothetical protein